MGQYLIVTHRTAFAPELRDKVRELIGDDPDAEFGILVPEAPGENYTWEGETVSPAQETADTLAETLETTLGASVCRIAVGVEDPLQAIAGELQGNRTYDALGDKHAAARGLSLAQAGPGAPRCAEVRATCPPCSRHTRSEMSQCEMIEVRR